MARSSAVKNTDCINVTLVCGDPHWNELVNQHFTHVDVYHNDNYVGLYKDDSTQAQAFFYQTADGCFFLPYLKKPVLWFEGRPTFVIESPYGFAGPLIETSSPKFIHQAWTECYATLQAQNVIAGLIRFNPLDDVHGLSDEKYCKPELQRPVVVLNLAQEFEAIWSGYRKDVRNKINKANKAGVEIVLGESAADWLTFAKLYRDHMQAKDADDFYQFDDNYFNELRNGLSSASCLLMARVNGQVCGGAILLSGNNRVHYHLSFVTDGGKQNGTANLLRHTAITQSQSQGAKIINFGGGTSNSLEDSLLRFKQGFSQQVANFYIAKLIVDSQRLNDINQAWERLNPNKIEHYSHFHLKCLQ